MPRIMTIQAKQAKPLHDRGWGPRGTAAATFAGRLTFENVSLAFDNVEAVRSVSFELKPGEIVSLLGQSGCGKTTLLRIAAGVERPQSGRVLIDDIEVASPTRFVPPEKRGVGLMYQDFALFPHLSIIDNVAFGLRNLSRPEALREARNALARVGLAEYENSFPHALSGGEQQRVALARAIVPRPQVMLMDEPFSGLDQRLRESVRSETLALLKETRATTMLVTHDPVEAMELSDRILLMRQGQLVQTGTPAQLYETPTDAQTARFFCDFNELTAIIRNGHAGTVLGIFPSPALREGTAALVMIRPQGFERAKGDVGIEGYILDSHFLGDVAQCSVVFKGIDNPLSVRLPAKNAPKAGQSVFFSVDPAQVLVFPQASEAPI
jgi:iron(III) transport system ATP-binding protein